MRRRELKGLLILFALSCCARAAVPGCDIAAADLKNRVMSNTRGALRLRNGVFREWDAPAPATGRNRDQQKPDWQTTIERDVLIQPADSGGVRLLVLNRVHLTGSGSFTYVFGFRCVSGSIKKIFETSGEGLRVEKVGDDGVELTRAIWKPDDAHCCPSREERLRYIWSAARKRFVRERLTKE